MRGKKGLKHANPDDPPRRRANKAKGHGTWETDRPPVFGITGRVSGEIHLHVSTQSNRAQLEPVILAHTADGTIIHTDEWGAYNRLTESARAHATVNHGQREWSRDDDGDGVREVHCNTMEGIWTGLRNFLRLFRGVSKHYLNQYVAMFEWQYRLKTATIAYLRALLGYYTFRPT